MKTNTEECDDSILDIEDFQVERALANAALDAIKRARRFGTDFVVEEEGTPKSLRPDETGPYEKRLLEDLDRINRKIAELQAQKPDALSLNDKPKP
jgi:DNA-directed RNA polymerase specialized sigma24 family protein